MMATSNQQTPKEASSTVRVVNPCAWCLRDRHEAAQAGDSHGICRWHADGLLWQLWARKLARAISKEHSA